MQSDVEVIGISVMAPSLPTVLCAVQKYKEDHPGKTIILGGPSATDTPLEILENFPVDIIVMGEGESIMVDLMEGLSTERLAPVKGIFYREGDTICRNERPPRIRDLDSLPFPAYHFIDFNLYRKTTHLMTARGCPYSCAFCSAHSIWEHTVTFKSMEKVVEELSFISERIEQFMFADDILMLSRKRVARLCELLSSEGIDMPWICNGRINYISRDLLEMMTSSGLKTILYGIESGSNEILKTINKEFTIEEARRVVNLTAEYATVEPSYIWGFPFETLDQFFETLFCITADLNNPRINPQLLFLNPLPRSPLFEKYKNTLRFSPELIPGISRLPENEKLHEYPDLVKSILLHPVEFASYYFYDHDTVQEKYAYISTLSESL